MALTFPPQFLERLPAFCARWNIAEFAVFGSALRDDFGPQSDVDILVTPAPGVVWGIDEHLAMRDELEALLARRVDFVTRASLRNPFRRSEILRTRRVLHAA